MTDITLSERTAHEIQQRVTKVLQDLGNPNPPLDLDAVRELLRLDKHYYSSGDSGIISEVIHHLRIGAKQVFSEPMRVLDAIRKADLRALWVPHQRKILIDSSLPELKRRWGEAHEITHSLIPYHQILTLGDPDYTLKPDCHDQLEAEANYGAGWLLFLGERFREELLASPLDFARVRKLSTDFGNTITSTLWRAVENATIPTFALVSAAPWNVFGATTSAVRHFVRSPTFRVRYANLDGESLRQKTFEVVSQHGRGVVGADEIRIEDDDGGEHVFFCECFWNSYDLLTLGVCRSKKPKVFSSPVGEVGRRVG